MARPGLSLPSLCLVTDRHRTVSGDLVATVEAVVTGGVGMVHLREKDLPAGDLLRLAQEVRDLTRDRALLLVNDRVDVALLCNADGVQLGEDALGVASARELTGADMLVGRSVHSIHGAVRAETEGADFLVLGTIFQTASHPGAFAGGLDLVRSVRARVDIPILGIGGVTDENVSGLLQSGADGAAVITALSMAPDPTAAALAMSTTMRLAYTRPQAER